MKIMDLKQARSLGLRYYFTGEPCRRGHICNRLTSARACTKCQAYKTDKWQKENNKRTNLKSKKWRMANPDKMAAAKKAWNLNNPDKIKELHKKWCCKNRDKRSAWGHRRAARKLGNGGIHTRQDIAEIMIMQGGKCAYFGHCGTTLTSKNKHIDHIVPLVTGGSNNRRNIQILCRSCNCSKSAKDPLTHCQSLGWLL